MKSMMNISEPGWLIEQELTNVLDNADDFPGDFALIDLATEGGSVEEAAIGERATDERLSPGGLAGAERASLDDAQPQGLDEPRTHGVQTRGTVAAPAHLAGAAVALTSRMNPC